MKMTIPPICVVDDDVAIREAVESLLRAEGFEVELFASAQRFMTRATMAPLSCVILDVELPGLSGLDLQRELSARDLGPDHFSNGTRKHSHVSSRHEGRRRGVPDQAI